MMTQYADLEIRILKEEADGYPVDLTLNHEQEYERGYLDGSLGPWEPSDDPAVDGQRLFDWLFADDALKRAWAEVRGRYPQRRVRLRIDGDAPALHAIPWELLRDAVDGALAHELAAATATPFSRYLAGRWQPGSPILQRPLKVLVAIVSPRNLGDYNMVDFDVAQEWAVLQESMSGLDVKVRQLPEPCTFAALEAELKEGYHILHVVGHGAYDAAAGSAFLMMANDANEVEAVADTEFAEMLARQLADTAQQHEEKLRLVFLDSCQTATRDTSNAFRGLAPKLVQAGVPAVVAMQDAVVVETGQAFSRTFYRQLLQHGQVDLAANEARAHLLTAKLPGASIPVLFMRLRDGMLLGKRGRIAGDKSESFWPFLLENIRLGHCIPFLGPGLTTGLLPDAGQVAEQLADKYGYPLDSRTDLAKVTRYVALHDADLLRKEYTRILRRGLFSSLGIKPSRADRERYRDANFTETAAGLKWAERVLSLHENEVHHLLADLRLPLYITTNADSFMVEALRHQGVQPRRVGPRWEQVKAGTPQFILQPEPSREQPVVFHLNGYDEDPEQQRRLVLTEDDYLAHFVRLARDHNTVLPMNVVELLGKSSFLFLGYSLNDWEFRVILQGLVNAMNPSAKLNVGVQLEDNPALDTDKVIEYLGEYMGKYNIKIYWGTSQQFVAELHAEWQRSGGGETGAGAAEEWDDDDW